MKINVNNYEAFLLDYIEGNLSAEQTAELLLFLQQHPEIDHGIDNFKIISLKKEEASFSSKNELKRKEFVVNDDLIEGLIISYVNGDLSKAEEKKLLEIVSGNGDYSRLLSQYELTRLKNASEKLSDKVLLKGHLPVTSDNAEYFIIAEMEGVLTAEEEKSLDAYRKRFPGIKPLAAAYSATRLPAEKIIFENKSALRKKEGVVILFTTALRYTSIAAAACLLLYFGFFTGEEKQESSPVAEEKTITPEKNNIDLTAKENSLHEKSSVDPVVEERPEKETQVADNLWKENKNDAIEKQKNTPQIKEPVIDGGVAHEESPVNENKEPSVLMAREELPVISNNDPNILANVNTNLSSLSEDDFITAGQYVRNWAKKTFFTEVAEEKHKEESTELADNTLRLKGTNSTITNSDNKEYKKFGFSIGKIFSFERKVRK